MRNPEKTVAEEYVEEKRKWKKAHPDDFERMEKNEKRWWMWLKDYMYAKANELGIRTIINDGSKSIDELTEIVREHFRL